MREHIDTIPLSEALELSGECLFCAIERRLEADAVDYALGASMMEPDSRIESNEKGFCRRHFHQMQEKNNALSLALVLDTRLAEVRSKLEQLEKNGGKKQGLFKKQETEVSAAAEKLSDSCVICEKLERTLARYRETFWHLYEGEPEFREKILAGTGFCLPHFAALLKTLEEKVRQFKQDAFRAELFEVERRELERLNGEVHHFTKKFDYRYQNEPWGTSKDSPQRVMEKLVKFL